MKQALVLGAITLVPLLFPVLLSGRQAPEELTRDKVMSTPEWQQKYDAFEPAANMLDAIKTKLGSGETVDIYLGLWCPDSRNHVPTFLKMLDKLETGVPVRYFGVPRKPSKEVKFYFEEKQVEKVPTFIFYRDGKEIGRIVEKPKTGIVEDTMDIVFK
jgi:thiol-disulfide isomerase/thioredoxin